LKETEHLRPWRQEKVAKIVQCGEKIEAAAIRKGGLKFFTTIYFYDPFILFLRPIYYRAADPH